MFGWPDFIWRRREALLPADKDLARRREVWAVLSELYLDTELSNSDYDRIAKVLKPLEYGTTQLEEILFIELHPILLNNLMNPAGHYSGFDHDWLEKKILKRNPSRRNIAFVFNKSIVRDSWKQVLRALSV